MYGYIYLTTNLINNKIYVGQHKSSTIYDNYLGSGVNFKKALKKYGRNNFKKEILTTCDNEEELNLKEMYYIELYNAKDITIGYNISQGGKERFFTGLKHSELSKQKMSITAKNRVHKPTTSGNKWMHKGDIEKSVPSNLIDVYLAQGFQFGRLVKQVAWNKNKTKNDSEILYKQSLKRKELLNNHPIGCYGRKGKENSNFDLEKYNSLLKLGTEIYSFWYENGKCATKSKYKISDFMYEELCKDLNIIETKEHRFYIKSKAFKKRNK